MESQTINMKVLIEMYLKNNLRNQFLKVENSLLELGKVFIDLNDKR